MQKRNNLLSGLNDYAGCQGGGVLGRIYLEHELPSLTLHGVRDDQQ